MSDARFVSTLMPVASKVSLESFVAQCHCQMVPLNKSFSYFSATPLEESELKKRLYDPIAAMPPRVSEVLSNLRIVLVPYLEKGKTRRVSKANTDGFGPTNRAKANGRTDHSVAFKPPAASRQIFSATSELNDETFLFLSVSIDDLSEYHYFFYNSFAALLANRLETESQEKFGELLKREILSETHGEVDEKSWRLKERILRKRIDPTGDTKPLRDYFRQALEDTLTLYLHGLCCDIDIEAGPRQLASRYLRRRLMLLRELLPPPSGFALFPEEL